MSTAGLHPVSFEPHLLEIEKPSDEVIQRTWGLRARVDPTVSFEEYVYWARIERAEDREANRQYVEERGPLTAGKVLKGRFSKGIHHEEKKKAEAASAAQLQNAQLPEGRRPSIKDAAMIHDNPAGVSDEEWKTAARALRTASWGTIFYLITTDILGWSTTPYVFASVGWGLGISLYVIFGAAAAFSGWILWKVYLTLDSSRFPMVSYGDTFFRVFGKKSRHFINVTQALQQFMTVAVLILGSATTISQLSMHASNPGGICFVVCMIIVMVIGAVLGSVRSLQRLGWLCNLSVWLNVVSFLIIMIACANNGIDYDAVFSAYLIKVIEPVRTFAGPPPDAYQLQAPGFAGQFNGINSMVYSYGGALLFIAFLAEMRHPWDFWKGMVAAQSFICVVYIFFGGFVYGHFGQYSIPNIGNAIQPLHLQQAGNIIGLITGFIACLLYFNIGMKTVYIEVFQEAFNFPDITTKRGRIMWYLLGPMYWALAFVVAAAVPNLNGIASLVGALLILNFTYTFPAILYCGFLCQQGAALPGEGFDPRTGVTTRHDTGFKRWTRGFKTHWFMVSFSFLYFIGGLVCSGMGTWAAVEGLIAVFGGGGTVATSFGCASPV